MASSVKTDSTSAARAAAAAAAAAAARAAAERLAAAAARAHAAPAPARVPDSVHAGADPASRRDTVARLGGAALRQDTPYPPAGTPTFKASEVLRNPSALNVIPAGVPTGGPAAPPADDGSYDRVEQIRAERARQEFLDGATRGLPPDQAQQVKDAAGKVAQAQQGLTDPGQRARATAEAVAAQAGQFKNNPAAAKAFVAAIAPELQAVGRDLSPAITTPLHGDADRDTGPTVKALAQACGALGDGASLDLGRSVAAGLPDTGDLNHLDDRLEDAGMDSEGGRRLLFSVASGLAAQGKGASAGDLSLEQRQVAMLTLQPGEVVQPVDPRSPDALGQAQLRLAYARAMPGEFGNADTERYITALQVQLEAFKDDPAARQALAGSQLGTLQGLVEHGASDPATVRAAFEAADAAGPAALTQMAAAYAAGQGPSRADLGAVAQAVSPRAATELAFAFDKAGNADQARTFAARAAQLLDGAAGKAKEANDTLEKAQAKLDTELAKVGPALTPAQRADYEKRFWAEPDNARAVEAAKAANAGLQRAVAGDLDSLKRLAAIDPSAAKATAAAMTQLARDPAQAKYVEDTTRALVSEPAFASAQEDLGKASVAASQIQAQAMIARGETDAALEKLKSTSEFLEHTTWASTEMKEFVSKGLPELKKFTEVVASAVKARDLSKISAYFADAEAVKKLEAASEKGGGLGKAFGAMVKGVGVASYLMEASRAPGEKERLLAAIKAGNGAAELVADGFKALGQATHDASSEFLRTRGATVAELGEKLSKVTGAVGFGLSLFSDARSIAEAVKDPNLKTVGAAVGDTLSAVGAGIALIPGGEVVGGAIAFVGAGVSFVTGLIQERRDDDARQADTESLLKQVLAGTPGLTSAQVDTAARRLAGTEANLDGIARDAQLTPDQLVRLAASQPALDGLSSRDLDQVAKYSGLSGQAFVDWVARLSPQALNQLQSGVVTELKNGIEQGARQTAYQEALRAHDYEGKDFATVEAQVYQREYEKQMKDMLRGQGLIP